MSERRSKALSIIARISGKNVESIEPEQDLTVDLGISSPMALELLVELEEGLEIEISDEEAAEMQSVADVLRFVEAA